VSFRNIPQAILDERQRQVEQEGWTPQHDDEHADGELMLAAKCYAGLHHPSGYGVPRREDGTPVSWPWHADWWKPKGARRDLERAGALCLAERDRLDRRGAPTGHVAHYLSNIVRWAGAKGAF
jgi:hypothetical protein